MSFSDSFEQINDITMVLLMFLRGHFEAILHCVTILGHFTIHLRGKSLCIFIDFNVFGNQEISSDFRSGSLCVVLNACLTSAIWAYRADF